MKNIFIWDEFNRYFIDQHGQYFLQEKPTFSFEYDKIIYHNDTQSYFKNDNGFNMNEQECSEIENFIEQKRDEVGVLKHCIDENGKYLGFVNVEREDVFKSIPISPLTADNFWMWNEETSEWKRAYYYNTEGELVDANSNDAVGYTFEARPEHVYFQYQFDQDSKTWIRINTPESLEKYKKEITINLLNLYMNIIISDTDVNSVFLVLKSLNQNSNPKLQIIETALTEINEITETYDIESIYEIINMITTSISNNNGDTN